VPPLIHSIIVHSKIMEKNTDNHPVSQMTLPSSLPNYKDTINVEKLKSDDIHGGFDLSK